MSSSTTCMTMYSFIHYTNEHKTQELWLENLLTDSVYLLEIQLDTVD